LTPLANIHDDLGDALAEIAAALQIPVLVLALFLLLVCSLEVGRFVGELWRRQGRAGGRALRATVARAIADPSQAGDLARQTASPFAADALREIAAARGDRVAIEGALSDYELAAQRRLDRTRMLVRAGPATGLMGTLIPLAPGLAALGRGDVASLASDLQIAFAATVLGLLVGTVAFALTLTRTRMYSEDLVALERAAAVAAQPGGAANASSAPAPAGASA
jgi:biopolymer transport protein ExbB/TolQ